MPKGAFSSNSQALNTVRSNQQFLTQFLIPVLHVTLSPYPTGFLVKFYHCFFFLFKKKKENLPKLGLLAWYCVVGKEAFPMVAQTKQWIMFLPFPAVSVLLEEMSPVPKLLQSRARRCRLPWACLVPPHSPYQQLAVIHCPVLKHPNSWNYYI